MNERRRDGQPQGALSRMPQDPAYWDGLAERVAAEAAPILAGYRRDHGGWWTWVADRSPSLASAALIAATLAWLFLPPAGGSGAAANPEAPRETATSPGPLEGPLAGTLARALAPADPVAARVGTDPVPPAIGELVLRFAGRTNP